MQLYRIIEKQDLLRVDYLNPEFCHTSGGDYWFKKFNDIIIQLTNNVANYRYEDSIRLISRNISCATFFL